MCVAASCTLHQKKYSRFHSEKLWIGSVFRLVFHVALLHFFYTRHMLTLLCECGSHYIASYKGLV